MVTERIVAARLVGAGADGVEATGDVLVASGTQAVLASGAQAVLVGGDSGCEDVACAEVGVIMLSAAD